MDIPGCRPARIGNGLRHATVLECAAQLWDAFMDTEPAHRKLTTILAADAVGYSHLMATHEEATLAVLKTYREIIVSLVTKHGGRVFNTAGDAVLAEFGSAVEAVRCAVSIQEDLRVRNAQQGEDGQLWFRIGINVGDVMIEGGDLFGDGVNVAARLEGLAEKGGICISGSTFEQVKNKLSVAFSDLGPQKVKNIPEPVSAFRIVPGQVAVTSGTHGASSASGAGPRDKRQSFWMLAGAAIVLVIFAGVGAWGYFEFGSKPVNPFDGRWEVNVRSRTGCLSNEDVTYPVFVNHGVIDLPEQRLPKKGTVSVDGQFDIQVFDASGRLLNTQRGRIEGDTGSGQFIGQRPSCTGQVEIKRMG